MMSTLPGPVVHYVPDVLPGYIRDCRNAIVTGTSPSGNILSLAIFNPGGIQFKRGIYHAPPPEPGISPAEPSISTWHHLAECVP